MSGNLLHQAHLKRVASGHLCYATVPPGACPLGRPDTVQLTLTGFLWFYYEPGNPANPPWVVEEQYQNDFGGSLVLTKEVAPACAWSASYTSPTSGPGGSARLSLVVPDPEEGDPYWRMEFRYSTLGLQFYYVFTKTRGESWIGGYVQSGDGVTVTNSGTPAYAYGSTIDNVEISEVV